MTTPDVTPHSSAQASIQIENEEMQDQQIEDALTQAARRGVSIQVVLPTPTGGQDSNAAGVTLLRKAGISVRGDSQYYIHAKLMLIDQTRAYVGSENISTASLDHNRELGLIVADPDTAGAAQLVEALDEQGEPAPASNHIPASAKVVPITAWR